MFFRKLFLDDQDRHHSSLLLCMLISLMIPYEILHYITCLLMPVPASFQFLEGRHFTTLVKADLQHLECHWYQYSINMYLINFLVKKLKQRNHFIYIHQNEAGKGQWQSLSLEHFANNKIQTWPVSKQCHDPMDLNSGVESPPDRHLKVCGCVSGCHRDQRAPQAFRRQGSGGLNVLQWTQ